MSQHELYLFEGFCKKPQDVSVFAHNPIILHLSLRDLSPDIILASNNIVDDVDHCLKAATSLHLTEQEVGNREFVTGTIDQLVLGKLTLNSQKPTIYSPFVQNLQKKHQDIYVILAPPRCSSTAFARVFWEHPSISFYCHEPFDVMYYGKLDFNHVLKALECPLNLKDFTSNNIKRNNLVIKEMTFQVGHEFSFLASLTKKPIIFLIRDPRLSILSRIKKLIEAKEEPEFSLLESGWVSLNYQIEQCKKNNTSYLIVDSKSFRNYSEIVFKKLFNKIEMDFSSTMLHWKPAENLILGNLGDKQKHWYQRILESTGIQIENEPVPEINLFPETNGFRDHIKKCLEIYENLHKDVNIVKP